MTCYLRHLESILTEMGYGLEDRDRRSLDKALHRINQELGPADG